MKVYLLEYTYRDDWQKYPDSLQACDIKADWHDMNKLIKEETEIDGIVSSTDWIVLPKGVLGGKTGWYKTTITKSKYLPRICWIITEWEIE